MNRRKKLVIGNLLIILIGLIVITAGILFITHTGGLATGKKNILVCAIDEGEIRPGMGACDMAFIIHMKNGVIQDYTPVYPSGLTHPTASEPSEAQAQGAGPKLLLHDAFWEPDAKLGMKYAKEIVEYQKDVKIDSVVAINSEALDEIIKAASPLEVNGETISASGIDFIREEQNSDGATRGDAVLNVVEAIAQSANDPAKKSKMVQTAIDQYSKGNIVMDQEGAFVGLLASKGIENLF